MDELNRPPEEFVMSIIIGPSFQGEPDSAGKEGPEEAPYYGTDHWVPLGSRIRFVADAAPGFQSWDSK
jgi:hypothetical protein